MNDNYIMRYSEPRIYGLLEVDAPGIKLIFPDETSFEIAPNPSKESIDFKMPEVQDKDLIALGDLVTAWSDLEVALKRIFENLLGVGYGPAAAISFEDAGVKLIKLVENQLNIFNLEVEEKKRFKSLCRRFTIKNTARNKIVHGFWRPLVKLCPLDNETNVKVIFARESDPRDIQTRQSLWKNEQKALGKYSFSTDRMNEISFEIRTLESDYQSFFTDLNLRKRFNFGRVHQ